MHVAVLGAGVTGVTAAYYLVEAGHTVTLIDREDLVANATSHANGAQLCYSFTDAMASPRFAAKLPGLIVGIDLGVYVRPSFDLEFARWGMSFLAQCTARKAAENTLRLLQLALRSQQLLRELRQKIPDDFSFREAGKLVLMPTAKDADYARDASALKAQHGCTARVISIDQAVEIEPSIAHMTGNYAAAVYSPGDEVGDACAFTATLTSLLQRNRGFKLMLSTQINKIAVENGQAKGVVTDKGVVDADAIVVSLGVWSGKLLKPLGIHPGIYPARGYSVTLPAAAHTPTVSVTDLAKRFVISRLGGKTRIAGFADFVGYDTSGDERRVADLIGTARTTAPGIADFSAGQNHAWGGFRPLTASGQPLVGSTDVSGLFLNTGHGSLGWTLACVSGHDVASTISGSVPERARAA